MPDLIGHRGWPARYPDNTLSGFLAVSGVADGVELDVRRSGDGKLVLSHDPMLGGQLVHDTPWSVLADLDLGDGHHPALLDEVLAALPGVPVQLEVKNDLSDPGFEPDHRLALETAERARPDDTVTSFNKDAIATVRRVFPDVATGLAMEFPDQLDDGIDVCRRGGHVALVPRAQLVQGPVPSDIRVYPWTVNTVGQAIELAEWGVSGIITDDPLTLIEALRKR